ncbi:unnamed protein product [Laminaria digitata]
MTALKLEKTVAMLGLAPRRIVVQGLAPLWLLKGGEGGSSPLVLAGDSSDKGMEDQREAETAEVGDDNLINSNSNSSSSEDLDLEEEEVGQEDMLFSDESNRTCHDYINNNIGNSSGEEHAKGGGSGSGYGKTKHPIHAALVAGGINLRPRETRPLLRALGVSPHRLVKLGLVKREAARAMPGRRGGGPGQLLRAGAPRKGRVGRPRGPPHGSPHAPPHAHYCCGPSPGCGPSGSVHGPPRRPAHGAGHHAVHLGEESEEEDMSAPLGPHAGPGHRGPRHQGGRLQGPPRGMPIVRHGRGPPGSGKHSHGHSHSPHAHGRERIVHGGGARGPGQHGPRCHGGGIGRPRGPPHAPADARYCCGPSSGGLHGQSEGEGGERLRGGARGPGQHGPRQHGGAMGRPRGPPHAPAGAHYCCGLWSGGGLHGESGGEGGERLRGGARGPGQRGPRRHGGGMGRPRDPPHAPAGSHYCCRCSSGCGPSRPMHGPHGPPRRPVHVHLGEESKEESMSAPPLGPHGGPGRRGPRQHGGGGGMAIGKSLGRPRGPPHGSVHGPFHGLFHEGASGAPPGNMAHPHHGSPSRGGCDVKQRGGRHGGGMGYCRGGGRGSGGGGGGDQQLRRMAHLARFNRRHQPQLEAY